MTSIITITAAVVAALLGAIYGVITGVKKIRENAVLAEQKREEEVQKRIQEALEGSDDRVIREKEISAQWKELALVRESRLIELQEHVNTISTELKELRERYTTLTSLYTSSQTKLAELERQFSELKNGK